LEDGEFKLLRYPVEEYTQTGNTIIYKLPEIGVQISRKTGYESLSSVVEHKTTVTFELSTPNQQLYWDFRNRYQNLNFLSNFTTFLTPDSVGTNWSAFIKWGVLSPDNETEYSADSKNNFAFKIEFSCELYYHVVYNTLYTMIYQIVYDLVDTTTLQELN